MSIGSFLHWITTYSAITLYNCDVSSFIGFLQFRAHIHVCVRLPWRCIRRPPLGFVRSLHVNLRVLKAASRVHTVSSSPRRSRACWRLAFTLLPAFFPFFSTFRGFLSAPPPYTGFLDPGYEVLPSICDDPRNSRLVWTRQLARHPLNISRRPRASWSKSAFCAPSTRATADWFCVHPVNTICARLADWSPIPSKLPRSTANSPAATKRIRAKWSCADDGGRRFA